MSGTVMCAGHEVLLTGREKWPVHGELIDQEMAEHMVSRFAIAGMKRFWHCEEKAAMIRRFFGFPMHFGELKVWSGDMASTYGFDFNPPFEFHAWNTTRDGHIIDFALPGVIEMGMSIRDSVGPMLVGRKPIILAAKETPSWLEYKSIETWL